METLLPFAHQLADAAGAVIRPYFGTTLDVEQKSDDSPVSRADREAEAAIRALIAQHYPEHAILGEEFKNTGDWPLATGDYLWVIDPIDGTSNFVNGIPRFAVIIALIARGETIMGWIHDPLTGHTIAAEQGAGAWETAITGDVTRRELPAPPFALKDMTVALHPRAFAKSLGKFARNLRLGSAAQDYWTLTAGGMQLLAYRSLKPWDHAAGVLIHREAGGHNAMLNGMPYRPALPNQEWLLLAPNDALWREAAEMAER